jgi:hypothetical protein
MMRRVLALAAASLLGLAGVTSAADFDGTRALVCTFDSAAECDADAQCTKVSSGEIDLPESISVDFNAHRLRSPDGQRTSPIDAMAVSDAVLIAQGNQNGRAWSMTLDRTTGGMIGTIAEPAGAFVLTGSCTNAP